MFMLKYVNYSAIVITKWVEKCALVLRLLSEFKCTKLDRFVISRNLTFIICDLCCAMLTGLQKYASTHKSYDH